MTNTVGPRKIAVGNLGEFWYGDYKEPFVQMEGAVEGHPQGVLLKDDAGKLLCAYCGKTFDNLGRHTAGKHGLPATQYKTEVGLLQKSALVSERVRQGQIRTALRNRSVGKFSNPAGGYKARVVGTNRNVPEWHNKTGRCYAQILTIARQMVREDGRVTVRALAARGIAQRNVKAMFGDMESLRRLAGDGRRTNAWSKPELINALRSLAHEIGRTPAISDLSRFGLPHPQTFANHFGSYVAACVRAGLPPVRVPLDPSGESAILLAWATTGDTGAAARVTHRARETVFRVLRKYAVPYNVHAHVDRVAAQQYAVDIAARLEGEGQPVAA